MNAINYPCLTPGRRFNFVPPELEENSILAYGMLIEEIQESLGALASAEVFEEIRNFAMQRKIVFSSAFLSRLRRDTVTRTSRGISCMTWDLRTTEIDSVKYLQRHRDGIGIGFDVSSCDDPIALTKHINSLALISENYEHRLVGDGVSLNILNSKIREFVQIKGRDGGLWRIATNARVDNIDQLANLGKTTQQIICTQICNTGDPGLVFWDRIESRNPNPETRQRIAIAPCGEIALSEGDGCVFAYVNLGQMNESHLRTELPSVSRVLVRFLDCCLEMISPTTVRRSRRIAVGVCGFADYLRNNDIEYGSIDCIRIAKRIGTILQYHTKSESTALAAEKGPYSDCFASDSRYLEPDSFLSRFMIHSSDDVMSCDWLELFSRIKTSGLRNSTTVVFPPTGKSSAYVGVTPGIDPYDYRCRNGRNSAILSGSISVPWKKQVDVAAAFSNFSDDSVSKTVVFPPGTSPSEIWDLIQYSYTAGLAGITAYVHRESI